MHELNPLIPTAKARIPDQYDEKSGIISVNESGKCIRELFLILQDLQNNCQGRSVCKQALKE